MDDKWDFGGLILDRQLVLGGAVRTLERRNRNGKERKKAHGRWWWEWSVDTGDSTVDGGGDKKKKKKKHWRETETRDSCPLTT